MIFVSHHRFVGRILNAVWMVNKFQYKSYHGFWWKLMVETTNCFWNWSTWSINSAV